MQRTIMVFEKTICHCANLDTQTSMSPSSITTKDGNVLVNLGSLFLNDAFAYPHKVAYLLQFQVAVAVVGRYPSSLPHDLT